MNYRSNLAAAIEENQVYEGPVSAGLPTDLAWLHEDKFQRLREARDRAIAEGIELTDLSMINPDIPPPRFCLDKLSEAILKTSNHRYSVARGIRKLRQAFSHKYASKFGVKVSADTEVCVTSGTKDALLHLLRVLAGAGDRVLIPSPTYPLYFNVLRLNGLRAGFFKVQESEEETLHNINKAISSVKPRVIILNFPGNPMGNIVSREFYEHLYNYVKDLGIYVINDFVYGEMGYRQIRIPSLLEVEGFKNCGIEIYSLSKSYSLPGWRIGAAIGNSDVISNLSLLKTHTDYGAFLPLQHAAAATLSLDSDLVAPALQQYQSRTKFICERLEAMGLQPFYPKSGCCVWSKLNASIDSEAFAIKALLNYGIVITPGEIFGAEYKNYFRLAAVKDIDNLDLVLSKIKNLI